MELINIGFGNVVSARKVVAVVSPESAPIKRLGQEARDRDYGQWTCGVVVPDPGGAGAAV